MKRNIKFLSIILTLVLSVSLIIGLTACGDNPTTTHNPDTLIVGSTMEINSLDRRLTNGGEAGYYFDVLSASLSQLTPVIFTGGEYEPLACDFKVSQDGLTVSLKVKDGYTWHDGTPLTNQDLMFTLSKEVFKTDDSVTMSEKDGWVNIVLSQPDPRFFDRIYLTRLLPKHIFDREDLATLKEEETIVGCGPFKFNKFDKNKNVLVFDKYASYPQADKIAFDKVIIKLYNDISVMDLALKRGEIDMMYNYQGTLTSDEIVDFSKDDSITLQSYGSKMMPKNLFFNVEKVPKNVRLAIRKALDYVELRRLFGTSTSIETKEGFVPDIAFGAKDTPVLEKNLEEAHALLLKDGYSETNKFKLEIVINDKETQIADRVKVQLESTNLFEVTVNISADKKGYMQAGNHMACFYKVSPFGFDAIAGYATKYLLPKDSEVLTNNPVCCGNIKLEENGVKTAFGEIFYALQNAKTNDELKVAVQAYQDYIVENAPAISLVLDSVTQAYSSKLTGFVVIGGYDLFNVKTFETLRRA